MESSSRPSQTRDVVGQISETFPEGASMHPENVRGATSQSQRVRSLITAVVVVTGISVVPLGPAHAVTLSQTCVGTWAVTYDPPITNTPQTVAGKLSGYFPACTDSEAYNGSYYQEFTDVVSCLTPLTAGTASRTFVWGNPAAGTSTFTYNWTVTDLLGQAVITNTGLITSGKFANDSAEQIAALVTPNPLLCATTGVASLTGPTTLTVFRL
jgi:hypothetical protein